MDSVLFRGSERVRLQDDEVFNALVERMRSGDVASAGEFVDKYGAFVLRTMRWCWPPRPTSADIAAMLPELRRRFEEHVGSRGAKIASVKDVWTIISSIINDLRREEPRIVELLRTREREAEEERAFAAWMLERLGAGTEGRGRREAAAYGVVKGRREAMMSSLVADRDRSVLRLWMDGWTMREIAAELEIYENTARKCWERARRTLGADGGGGGKRDEE